MWGGLAVGLLVRPWARRAAAIALVALTILLLALNLRRAGERAGRAVERLDQLERTHAVERKMLDAAARRPSKRDDLVERLANYAGLPVRSLTSATCWILAAATLITPNQSDNILLCPLAHLWFAVTCRTGNRRYRSYRQSMSSGKTNAARDLQSAVVLLDEMRKANEG